MGADAGERWDQIIHAAAAIFYEKGYEATSLQDIATAVGLLKGSIYYYIETKEDLLMELVTRAQDAFEPVFDEDRETAAAAAPQRLRAFVGRWMAMNVKVHKWNIVAEREFERLTVRNLHSVIERRDKMSTHVKDILRQGVNEGAFDPDTDISVATTAIFELLKTTRHWHRPSGRLSWSELGEWYVNFILKGLAPTRSGDPAGGLLRPAKKAGFRNGSAQAR